MVHDILKMSAEPKIGHFEISSIDPTKPTFASAQILNLAQKWQKWVQNGPPKNRHLLNLAISGFRNPFSSNVSNRSKGGTLTSKKLCWFSSGGSASPKIGHLAQNRVPQNGLGQKKAQIPRGRATTLSDLRIPHRPLNSKIDLAFGGCVVKMLCTACVRPISGSVR